MISNQAVIGPSGPALDEQSFETDDFGETLPVRPRRPFLTKWSAGLMALALAGVGFYAGVDVEKGKTSASGATAGGGSALASAGSARAGGSSARPTAGAGGPAGFAGAASSGTSGTVSSVDGNTVYLKSSDGNTVKVKLSSATTITKSQTVSNSKVYPGDEVVVVGKSASNGDVSATSVTDSGKSSAS
jgi:hypothetical protein